jgi:hypothetical protein
MKSIHWSDCENLFQTNRMKNKILSIAAGMFSIFFFCFCSYTDPKENILSKENVHPRIVNIINLEPGNGIILRMIPDDNILTIDLSQRIQ